MNAAEAEAIIRSQLDGHFFTLVFSREGHSEPRVSHTRVPLDYLPEYHLMPDETETAQKYSAQAEKKHRPWTDEEVKKLIVMRQAGTRWDYIAREIKRCNRAIKDRYRELEAELNLPKIATRQGKFSKLNDEQKAEILKRREDGETFEQIELATNIPKYVVRDYYHRHLRAMKERRMAA
jgi:hypothetical protein